MESISTEPIISEWHSKYLDVKVDKIQNILWSNSLEINSTIDSSGSSEESFNSFGKESEELIKEFSDDFFQIVSTDFRVVENFFQEGYAEAQSKFQSLEFTLKYLNKYASLTLENESRNKFKTCMEDLRSATMEFHLSLILLRRYQKCNMTRLLRIAAEFDRELIELLKVFKCGIFINEYKRNSMLDILITSLNQGELWLSSFRNMSPVFISSGSLDEMIVKVKNLYAEYYSDGDTRKADVVLKVPDETEKIRENYPSLFCNGLFVGASIALLTLTIYAGIKADANTRPDRQITVDLFRPLFLIIVFMIFSSLNILGCEKLRINRALLLDLDPRNHISYVHLFEISGGISVLWLSCLYFYFNSLPLSHSAYIWPALSLLLPFLYLINPFKIFYYKSRVWLLKLIGRTLLSPLNRIRLVDVWFTDQLISLVIPLTDLVFVVCFYLSRGWSQPNNDLIPCGGGMLYGLRPLINALPSWLRFIQCIRCYYETRDAFPHLVNAGKYSTTFLVVLFSSLRSSFKSFDLSTVHPVMPTTAILFYLWAGSVLVSSVYSFMWDVLMDWRLFDVSSPDRRWSLREERLFKNKVIYYAAIGQNLLLRFTWTLTLSVGEWSVMYREVIQTVVAVLELFRRFVWNFFRLEVEQLSNMGQLRAVREYTVDIPDECRQLLTRTTSTCHKGTTYGTVEVV